MMNRNQQNSHCQFCSGEERDVAWCYKHCTEETKQECSYLIYYIKEEK
jgi:hypothetical protein